MTNKADPTSLERNHKPRIFFSPSLVLKSYMCPEVYFETCFIFVYFRKYTSRHMLGGKKSSISEIPEVLSTRPLQKITGGTLSLRSVRMFTHGKKNTAYLSSRCVFLDKSRVFVLFGCSKIMCVSSKRKISLIIRDNKK